MPAFDPEEFIVKELSKVSPGHINIQGRLDTRFKIAEIRGKLGVINNWFAMEDLDEDQQLESRSLAYTF